MVFLCFKSVNLFSVDGDKQGIAANVHVEQAPDDYLCFKNKENQWITMLYIAWLGVKP